jgi:uncharacterized caspase-like protein
MKCAARHRWTPRKKGMITFLRYAACILCALFVAALSSRAAMAERRVALVIGNAKYEHADVLTNTVNDANAIAALLTKAGFDVVDERRDVGVVEFKRAVREFLTSATNADIAVVYYSGHGIEVGGTNYLIPVDAKLASDFDIDDEAIPLDRIILATQSAKKLSLIILDACRDNPFIHAAVHATATRSISNRLVGVQPTGSDTLIAYAAKAGSVSYDGLGANSPFTTALVKYLAEPGLDIRIALGKVRDDVLASTGNRQEPFVYGSLGGADISLVPPPAAPAPASAAADPIAAVAHEYEMAERVGARRAWESFLVAHSSGFYADLARAQLAKLVVAETEPSSSAKETKERADRLAATRREEEQQRVQAEATRPSVAPDAATSAPLAPDEICKRDESRLARLRANPSLEQTAQFARELACEDLRPQVQRLAESLGGEVVAASATPTPQPQTVALQPTPTAQNPDQACKRDEARLASLRIESTVEQVTQFARELGCEELRPQVQRLIESSGAEPAVETQTESLAPVSQSQGGAPALVVAPQRRDALAPEQPGGQTADERQACKRDSEELAHIRTNHDRASLLRLKGKLKCEALRAQVARLLENFSR